MSEHHLVDITIIGAGPVGLAAAYYAGHRDASVRIVESLGNDHVAVVQHDRYYRDRSDLRFEERAALNYDHPDSLETDLLVELIRRIQARGITTLLIEHDMSLVMRACENIVVLEYGLKIAEGTPEAIKANPRVVEAYLGTDGEED